MMFVEPQTWLYLGLALALGLFVGLEREESGHATGIRTFPLITILGVCSALLVEPLNTWVVPAALAVVAVALLAHDSAGDGSEEPVEGDSSNSEAPGTTTLVAALLMFLVGAMLVLGYTSVAVAVGGTTAVLLRWKRPLHDFVDRLGPAGFRAVYRFVLLAVVVLPVLPDQTYGPYDVFNPFRIWLVVVLIVGISVGGYILSKFAGARAGVVGGGILGGIVSSTAATVSYARRSARAPSASEGAAIAIMIASTLSFVRIVIEVLVVAWDLRWVVLPKFGVLIAVMALASGLAYWRAESFESEQDHQPEDPAGLKVAVVFGVMYAIILFAVAVTEEHFGDTGMYLLATISGLTDVDAITLSTAEMMGAGRVSDEVGWRMMMIGGMSNMLFKGGVAVVLGARRLRTYVTVLFGATLAAGGAILLLWPVP